MLRLRLALSRGVKSSSNVTAGKFLISWSPISDFRDVHEVDSIETSASPSSPSISVVVDSVLAPDMSLGNIDRRRWRQGLVKGLVGSGNRGHLVGSCDVHFLQIN